jgi:CRISPR-associated protein Cas2
LLPHAEAAQCSRLTGWIGDMARPLHLYVFAYDVRLDRDRYRLATLLEQHANRVQFSVFEGRMTRDQALSLAEQAAALIDPDDSLRVYCLTAEALQNSLAIGVGPPFEAGDFVLL